MKVGLHSKSLVFYKKYEIVLYTFRDVKVEEGYTPPPPYYRVNSRASKNRSPEGKERPVQTPVKEFRVTILFLCIFCRLKIIAGEY